MNNLKQILILVFLLFVSCGKNSSNSNTYTYNSVTLTGTISDASSGSSSLAISGSETDYLIMAQNQISNRIYLTQIESDGTFKFNSEGAIHTSIETVDHTSGHGDHFMFTLIKKDPLELKAIAFQEDSTSEGYSGIKIDTSLSESIQFAYSESDHKITVSETQLNSVNGISINKDFKVRLSNGKPVGIDDFGKSEISKTTDKSSSNILDPDQDGRPNIFDGMNDGANIDNLSEANKTVVAKSSHFPMLNFVMKFAVVGKTIMISAHLDKVIWSISVSLFLSNMSSNVLFFVSVVIESEVTNSFPLLVKIALTSTLFFFNNLIRSRDL